MFAPSSDVDRMTGWSLEIRKRNCVRGRSFQSGQAILSALRTEQDGKGLLQWECRGWSEDRRVLSAQEWVVMLPHLGGHCELLW